MSRRRPLLRVAPFPCALLLLLASAPAVLPVRGQGTPPAAAEATATPPNSYQPPKPLKRPPLNYPELARLNRIQGTVRLLLTVDEAGKVGEVVVMGGSGSLLLDQCVRDPIFRDYVFQPAVLNGKPVTGTFEQEVEFKLDPEDQRALGLKRAALPPNAGTPDPPYPEAARAKGLRGRVTLSVTWGANGLVERISLLNSSGNGLLDVTALRWAYENWRLDPKTLKEPQFVKTIVFDPALAPASAPPRS